MDMVSKALLLLRDLLDTSWLSVLASQYWKDSELTFTAGEIKKWWILLRSQTAAKWGTHALVIQIETKIWARKMRMNPLQYFYS